MDTTIIMALVGGVVCGAAGVGILTVGYLWWQARQRTEALKSSLSGITQGMPPTQPNPVSAMNYEQFMPPPSVPSPRPPDPPTQPAGVRAGSTWLDGVGGMVAGQRITISKEETLMGRSGVCDVQFHDPKVSRQHAMLRRYDNQYYLYDMQSSGGTFVNGQPIEVHPLQDYDQIRMGDTEVVFRRV